MLNVMWEPSGCDGGGALEADRMGGGFVRSSRGNCVSRRTSSWKAWAQGGVEDLGIGRHFPFPLLLSGFGRTAKMKPIKKVGHLPFTEESVCAQLPKSGLRQWVIGNTEPVQPEFGGVKTVFPGSFCPHWGEWTRGGKN